jgi:hypothetical protein
MCKCCATSSFVLIALATITFAQKPSTAPGDKFLGTFKPLSTTSAGPTPDPFTDYGLAPGQGIVNADVRLVMKRAGTPTTPKDVFGRAGRVIGIARTGPTGGVTFLNVPPGSYVVLFRVVEWVAPAINSTDRQGAFNMSWRAFPDAGYQYAIRASNLTFKAEELRRSRDAMYNQVINIAQEFELAGSAPVAIRAAIGHLVKAR